LKESLQPGTTGFFEQHTGPHHIGSCKGARVEYGPIDVSLRRRVDHSFNPMLTDQTFDQALISNIPMHKCIPGMRLDRFEICEIARVFQRIEIHHLMATLNNQATYKVRPDESRPSGYEDSHLMTLFEVQSSSSRESYNLFAPVFATS
jgi:hypothetical protein